MPTDRAVELANLLAARQALAVRPAKFEELLLQPITDGGRPVPQWAMLHNTSARFFCTGMSWFLEATRMPQKALEPFFKPAIQHIKDNTRWQEMPDPRGHWKSNFAGGQITTALSAKPMIFAKVAQAIAVCELALKAQFEKPNPNFRIPTGITAPEHIYRHMAVYPAVWHISGFTPEYLIKAEQAYPGFREKLLEEAGLTSSYVISDIAQGHCIPLDVANSIHNYASSHYPVEGCRLDGVRARPGQGLGINKASEHLDQSL